MYYRYERERMKAIWSEDNMFDLWLKVEVAASVAWSELGVIPRDDAEKIKRAKFDRQLYEKWFSETRHDVVSFTRSVTPSLGAEGRWIHHGLTSNDVKDTALSLQLVQAVDEIDKGIDRCMDVLKARAEEFSATPCMGRSHGVHAEPMAFGLKFALWWDEMRRHKKRLALTREMVAVGKISGPVGSYASIPPDIEESVCRQLGLEPAPVSNQILQRDRHAQFVQTLALMGASLEKFATEIRALQRTEVREVEEPFGTPGFVSTGSSSMPHKRNPELSERICGLARLVRGHAVTALDDVPLWHERDISHSSAERMILPDSALAIDYILDLFTRVVKGMRVFPDNMMRNLELTKGIVFSERVLLALVESGLDRTSAYELVQRHALAAWDQGEDFRDSVKADPEVTSQLTPQQLAGLFDYGYYLRHVTRTFDRLGFTTKEPAGATARN
jgi:adenylosuccinate lyase